MFRPFVKLTMVIWFIFNQEICRDFWQKKIVENVFGLDFTGNDQVGFRMSHNLWLIKNESFMSRFRKHSQAEWQWSSGDAVDEINWTSPRHRALRTTRRSRSVAVSNCALVERSGKLSQRNCSNKEYFICSKDLQ